MIFIFGLNGHFMYLIITRTTSNHLALVEKVFRLTLNFTRCSTYNTRAVYGLCHETYSLTG
jgi:hypothetical protein